MKKTLRNCTLTILGDSYSTFEGCIPAGNYVFYPFDGIDDVICPADTWWYQLVQRRQLRLLINDSSSGTTVSTSVREQHRLEDAFVMRMKNSLSADGIGGEKPDCIILFGGTNDDWLEVPAGTLQYEGWTGKDLKQILPAYCYMLSETVRNNPQAAVFAVINTDMKPSTIQSMQAACAHYGVVCVTLHDISKQCGHPDRLGMRQIADQIDQAMALEDARVSG